MGLSRWAWTRLNRLRTGVGRFGANMLRWGLSTNDNCDCGTEQTADHITSGRCPIYRPPEGINGLIVLDDETRAWLENNALDIWVVRDGTRKKKKIYFPPVSLYSPLLCWCCCAGSICCQSLTFYLHSYKWLAGYPALLGPLLPCLPPSPFLPPCLPPCPLPSAPPSLHPRRGGG